MCTPISTARGLCIAGNGQSSTFEYGPNGNYWKQTATYSNGTETTKYIGGLLEIVQGPSVTSYRHHIKANGRTVAVYSRGSNGANNTIYPLNDHLGSTDAVTNSSGTIIVKESFAAFGARRNGATWSGAPSGTDMTAIGDATRRGYTDHSMLDNIGLIHMNGRVMDPVLGRFVSSDPFIDGFMNTQGWNRYSYLKNSPLALTDMSGFGPHDRGGQVMPIDGDGGAIDANAENGITQGSLIQSLRTPSSGPDNIPPMQQMSMAERVSSMLSGFTGVGGAASVGSVFQWIPGKNGVQIVCLNPGCYNGANSAGSGPTSGRWQYVPNSGGFSGGSFPTNPIAPSRAVAPRAPVRNSAASASQNCSLPAAIIGLSLGINAGLPDFMAKFFDSTQGTSQPSVFGYNVDITSNTYGQLNIQLSSFSSDRSLWAGAQASVDAILGYTNQRPQFRFTSTTGGEPSRLGALNFGPIDFDVQRNSQGAQFVRGGVSTPLGFGGVTGTSTPIWTFTTPGLCSRGP